MTRLTTIGQQYGDQHIVEFLLRDKNQQEHFRVKCQVCGREKEMKDYVLRQGKGTSHSACGRGVKLQDKKFYSHWKNMRTRTNNPNYEHYDRYGGRGINSDAFSNFIDFYDMMYQSYKEHVILHGEDNTTLDRTDNDGDYTPSNCRWTTWLEQHGNTSRNKAFKAFSPDGKEFTSNNQCEFARQYNLSDKQINACLTGRFKSHLGWKFQFIK